MNAFFDGVLVGVSSVLERLAFYWAEAAATVTVVVAVATTWHIVQHKRDARAAAAWTGLVWLVPLLGFVLYITLGVNRIRRRARQLTGGELEAVTGWRPAAEPLPQADNLRSLALLVRNVTGLPLTGGNQVTALHSREALTVMIDAVNAARESVYLCSYIFGNDAAGKPLAEALVRAHERGVRVRVLIDGVGALYSLPGIAAVLSRQGVPVQKFLYSLTPWRMPYMNLRNHRKILVVDRQLGFTGGMNIRAGYLQDPPAMHDMHFRLRGPVVGHLLGSFAADWQFASRELIDHAYRGPAVCGSVLARGITAGPDADVDKRRLAMLSALNRAESRIRILTPYFVPEQTLLSAINLARLRGVQVQLVLPEKNNLRVVHWAAMHISSWLLEQGVEIYLSAPPFDHSKLMLVDDEWVCFGSGNWDARSFRLNFEFDLECYDRMLAAALNADFDRRVAGARRIDLAWYRGLPAGRRFRYALAHLMEPYL